MQTFAEATAIEPIGGGYRAHIHDGWDVHGHANGGYLLAIVARAMADVAGRPPLTITAHYLAPAPAGPCRVIVREVRLGKRMATLEGELWQGDRQLLQVLGTFAEQSSDPTGPRHRDGAPPELPDFDAAASSLDLPADAGVPAIIRRLDLRVRTQDAMFRDGERSGVAEMAGWFAFADGAPVDAIGLLLVADAFAPPICNLDLPVAWVPTVEFTVHIRGVPEPGPLRCRYRSRFIGDGLLDEDGEVWDSADNLVAQSRQLALVPRAR